MIGVDLSFLLFLIITFLILQKFIRPLVDFSSYIVVFFILSFYHLLAVLDATSGSLLSTNIDAQTFHLLASERSSDPLQEGTLVFGIDYQVYQSILTIVYWLFDSSKLIGNQLSILVFTFSLLIWVRFLNLFNFVGWHKVLSILLFALLPSVVIFGVTTLREPWQLLFMLSVTYNGIKYVEDQKHSSLLLLTISVVALSFMHKAMLIYLIFLCLLIAVWSLYNVFSGRNISSLNVKDFRVFFAVFLSCFILLLLFKFSNKNLEVYSSLGVLRDIFTGKTLDYLDWTTTAALASQPASAFPYQINATSWKNFLVSYPMVYLHYMFGPFLWQLDFNNLSDLPLKYIDAFLESLVRFLLIVGFLINFFLSSKEKRARLFFLFIIYISLTTFWAVASTNYGQSIRHHMVSGWIIILIGVPGLVYLLNFFLNNLRLFMKYIYKYGEK